MDPFTQSLLSAGLTAATPFVSKILGSAFGVDEASQAEKNAMSELNRVAQGGTTQAQAGAAYQRGKTLQDLQAMAAKGTAQQRAGLERQAMLQAPEIQAQQAAQLADIRSREQERARSLAAQYEANRAARELSSKQKMLAGAVEGAGGILAKQLLTPAAEPPKLSEAEALAYNQQQAASRAPNFEAWNKSVAGAAPNQPYQATPPSLDNRSLSLAGVPAGYAAARQAFAPPVAPQHVPIASDMAGSGMDLANWQTTPQTSGNIPPSRTPIAPDMSGSIGEVAPASLGKLYDPTELFRANENLNRLQEENRQFGETRAPVGYTGIQRRFRRGSL